MSNQCLGIFIMIYAHSSTNWMPAGVRKKKNNKHNSVYDACCCWCPFSFFFAMLTKFSNMYAMVGKRNKKKDFPIVCRLKISVCKIYKKILEVYWMKWTSYYPQTLLEKHLTSSWSRKSFFLSELICFM